MPKHCLLCQPSGGLQFISYHLPKFKKFDLWLECLWLRCCLTRQERLASISWLSLVRIFHNTYHPILADPGAVSQVKRKGATIVFKYRRKSPWVPTLTKPFPKIQMDDWAQKNLCIIVPNQRTASLELFSCVRTRRLLSCHTCLVCSPRLCVHIRKGNFHFLLS